MNKLLSAFVAIIVNLATNGFAIAQDEPRMTHPDVQQNTQEDTQPDAGTPLEPGDLVISEKWQEYLAALTKCESLSGSQKEVCIEAVKRKYGRE